MEDEICKLRPKKIINLNLFSVQIETEKLLPN